MLWKLILVGFGMVVGDVFMKQWMLTGASYKVPFVVLYLAALSSYGVSLTVYAYQLRTMHFGIATITPILVNIITISLISYFFYKEGLTLSQGTGILLAIVALILFSR